MNSNPKLSYAIAAILGGSSVGTEVAWAQTADTGTQLQEITVTAQRRSENIQNVPITIQAVTGEQLKSLNVSTVEDLLKYTPNVTFSGNGPGTGNIFLRGLSSGGSGNQSQSTTAPFPNVALYLDDQSMQFPARNNDVYLVDMERVEVLEGPQGTLFGGGSQAGAIRYITNRPKLNVTEGNVNASYGITAGGDPNSTANGTINLPLIQDKLSIRATVFTDHRGGYISNVPGTIQVPAAGPGNPLPGPLVRPASAIGTNAGITGDNLNTVDYNGFRVSALWQFNDDWNFLLQQNYQNFKADGTFYEEPISPNGTALGNYQVSAFAPNYSKDKYESTAWTLNGKITDALKGVYTGSYMVRHIDGQQDYSNYLKSAHGSYYDCAGQGAGYAYFRSKKPTTCYAPIGSWRDQVINTHQSHEFRLTTSEDYRMRATVGAFWESFEIKDDMNFNYMPIPQCDPTNFATSLAGGADCVEAVGPVPGYYATHPNLRTGTNTAFGEDVRRGYKQTAFFGSFDFDILPKVLTLTYGVRHYKYDEYEEGSEYYSATSSILNVPNGTPYGGTYPNPGGPLATTCPGATPKKYVAGAPCPGAAYGFGINLKKSESGFKHRANLTWHITPDILTYYTYSQGFRPGGFNRTHTNIDGSQIFQAAVARFVPGGPRQFLKPFGYESDNLVNNEFGVKSEFLEHRLQVNLSLYQMDWKGVQLPLFDPVHLGNTTFVVNGPTYRVKGVELQLVARVTDGLTVQGSASWNSTNQTDAPCLTSSGTAIKGNPTPAGQCITQVNGLPYTNPYGVLGTSPAFSPPLQFNLRARYDWAINDYKPFVSVGANHVGTMRNEPASFPDGNDPAQNPPTTTLLKYIMPGYTTYDAAIGVAKDQWSAQISGSNLGNSDASTNTSSQQFIKTVFPLRPRVLTLSFGYKFGGEK
jgi:iron complex outermembrane recepter protein